MFCYTVKWRIDLVCYFLLNSADEVTFEVGVHFIRFKDTEVRSLAARRAALVEKEKKSYQSYLFLTKLANFVRFIERDDFWSAQIVQINVPGGGSGVNPEGYGADRAGRWKEPELELVPRAGDHIVTLGALDGTEREKLEKLRLFYLDGLRHEGWDKFGRIDIKYKNQIVCTQ